MEEFNPETPKNPFEQTLIERIVDASSLEEMIAAIKAYYVAGGVVTTSNGSKYTLDGLGTDMQNFFDDVKNENGELTAVPTNAYGIRDRLKELKQERGFSELTQEDIEQIDSWIDQSISEADASQDATALRGHLRLCSEYLWGQDVLYPEYQKRIEQWLELINTLENHKKEEHTLLELSYPPAVWKAVIGPQESLR
jgi:hypothetical protein